MFTNSCSWIVSSSCSSNVAGNNPPIHPSLFRGDRVAIIDASLTSSLEATFPYPAIDWSNVDHPTIDNPLANQRMGTNPALLIRPISGHFPVARQPYGACPLAL